MIEASIGLIGVVLGFLLSVIYQEYIDRKKCSKLLAGMKNELRSNLYMIHQKRDVIKNTLKQISEDKLTPHQQVSFLRSFYDTHFCDIISKITENKKTHIT